MSLESSLQTLLGGLVSGRCYPMVAPAGTATPYICFQNISGSPFVINAVTSGNPKIQIDIIGTGYSQVKTLAASVRAALLISSLANSQEMEFDDFTEETRSYRVIMQYEFWTTT